MDDIDGFSDDYLEGRGQDAIRIYTEDLVIKYVDKYGRRPSVKMISSWVERLKLAYEQGIVTRIKK